MRDLPTPPVQLITGEWSDVSDLRSRVTAALRGGIRWIQLRSKTKSAAALHEAAETIAPLVREAGAMFIVNDRVDIARACRADGVHLPEDGMAAAFARRILGREAWIARSVHSSDAIASHARDLDAVQFGPVFETASKLAYGAPRGLAAMVQAADVAHRFEMRIIAVGGIDGARASECREGGADAVAVIGAIWDAPDVEAAARNLARAG